MMLTDISLIHLLCLMLPTEVIAAHEPFESVEKAVQEGRDVHSHRLLVEHVVKRKTVADTDVGRSIQENIRELEKLLQAYREGAIVENA